MTTFILNPHLSSGSISISLSFSTQLTDSIELFFLGEKTSTLNVDSSPKVLKIFLLSSKFKSKKWLVNWNCGDYEKNCKHLKLKIIGVFAADNFSPSTWREHFDDSEIKTFQAEGDLLATVLQ